MIEIHELTKRYSSTVVVDELSFQVKPGVVTGFLGPNGAGKTTTMRILLGLARATSGRATINGQRYVDLVRPLRTVGALLDANAVHPGRRARDHLRILAGANGIAKTRVAQVLDQVGLSDVAHKRVRGFSLGMRQRLGVAAALLGDPEVLLLDEPVNGLDPEGVRWIRDQLRFLAAQGRTVLLSSHLMSEMELTAERLVIIGRGRLIADTTVSELAERFQRGVLVRTSKTDELTTLLRSHGAQAEAESDGLVVSGIEVTAIGDLAASAGIPLHEITSRRGSLEDAYMSLTSGESEHRSAPERTT